MGLTPDLRTPITPDLFLPLMGTTLTRLSWAFNGLTKPNLGSLSNLEIQSEDHTDFGNKSHRYMNLQQIFRDRYKNRKNRDNCEVKVNFEQIITG